MKPIELVDAALERLYAEIPDMLDCKGHCWRSCGPIEMSDRERERIKERGIEIQPFSAERAARWGMNEPLHCAALTDKKLCAVYDIRPAICRMWGSSEGMECEWGCKPTRYLTQAEGYRVLAESFSIGGGDAMRAANSIADALESDEGLADALKRYSRGDRSAKPLLEQALNRLMEEGRLG